jgi:hypothetical protein
MNFAYVFLAIWQMLIKVHNCTSTGPYGRIDSLNSFFFFGKAIYSDAGMFA